MLGMEFPSANKQPAEGGRIEESSCDGSVITGFVDLQEMRSIFSYRVCSQIVQRPIYECFGKNGYTHIACASCVRNLPGSHCPGCKGVFQRENHTVEGLASRIRLKCRNDGCDMIGGYLDFVEHKRACPHAPMGP